MQGDSLLEIAHTLDANLIIDAQVFGYQIDSRGVRFGDLFFALKGEKTDGQAYLREAAKRGAVGAVVRKGCPAEEGLALLEVDDPLEALHKLARSGLERYPSQILGITGSVGKTTVKEFAATLLEKKFPIYKSPGSFNSQCTFPLNLLNRTGEEKLLVLEMGMSLPKEIERLVSIAAPDIAIITKIALSHVANFSDGLEGIANAKAEIFSQGKTRLAILDLEYLQYKAADSIRAEKITFSTLDRNADYYLSFIDGQYRIDERGVRAHQFDLPFHESHFLHDFTAALAAARQLGMTWDEIEQQIPKLAPPRMRFEQFEWNGMRFINDTYNANPASMRAALENLPQPKEGGKKIAVFGSMQKELGSFSKEAHEEIGRLAQKHVDILLSIGKDAEILFEAFGEAMKPCEHFLTKESLVERLREVMRPGDVILFKGARAMELEKVVETLCASSSC